MQRRHVLLSLASLALLAPSSAARADLVYEPPPRLEVRPDTDTYTSPPRSVTLHITNPHAEAVEVRGARLVVLSGGLRLPVTISRLEVDGNARPIWEPLTIAARSTVRMTLTLESLPPSALAGRRLDFSLRLQGVSELEFSLRRA